MAVYTHLSAEDVADLLAHYDVGTLVSAKGIAEGVSNSNWLVETCTRDGASQRFILTMYERRIETADLPFFLGLLDHLSARGCPVPRTIHDRKGAPFRMVGGKAVALIEFLPGVSVDHPTPEQAQSVGRALAGMHLAVSDFEQTRAQSLGLTEWRRILALRAESDIAEIDPSLPSLVDEELAYLEANWPARLPRGVTHCDLFPDNVLMLDDKVSGLIDFYFAADDFFAYDLAVTHAAWTFAPGGHEWREPVAAALVDGYEQVRPLSPDERAALPVLARGASMRFIASRAADWIDTPRDALVTRKDPMDFARRLATYRKLGASAFATGTAG